MARAVLFLALLGSATSKNFLGSREVDSAYIDLVIRSSLDEVFGSGHGVHDDRLTSIKAHLSPLFNALPKNSAGRLNSASMRYTVQRYFSQRHGWVVNGFEPHASNKSAGTEVSAGHIVHGKIPGYVEGVLKKTLAKGGFALQDIAILVSAIETLIFDENLKSVEAAYRLNGLSTMIPLLDLQAVGKVLTSYFIIEHLNGDSGDVEQHKIDKANIGSFYPHWQASKTFMSDIVGEDMFSSSHRVNPFAPRPPFNFEDMARITKTISERFGPFSNHECHDMKMKLAEADVHSTGRIKLSDFYRAALQDGPYQFFETQEYLGLGGALDSSSSWQGPQVIIANYLTGINNCISTSTYYDICCLNECDGIYLHLEARFRKPTASPEEITQAIEGGINSSHLLSSTAPTEPRKLDDHLLHKLSEIAEHHDGQIPLHGRLFAQWLHFAFPLECPFPHLSGSVRRETIESLKKSSPSFQSVASDAEMLKVLKSDAARRPPSVDGRMSMWTLEEELLLPNEQSSLGSSLRTAALVLMFVSFLALALKDAFRLVDLRPNGRKQGVAGQTHRTVYNV